MDEIEIPEAIRENAEVTKKSRFPLALFLIIIAVLCLGMGVLLSIFFWSSEPEKPQDEVIQPTLKFPKQPSNQPITKSPKSPSQKVKPDGITSRSATSQTPNKVPSQKTDLLGHLPYDVAPQSDLKAITTDNRLQMRTAAADKFQQMRAAAQADGIALTPISAFRTTEAQEKLFFGVKEQKVQNAAKRAEVSAPPGYSEHHTGYAVDIGDANAPATHVETSFADTPAFAWLKQNAPKYSFELSFPPNNEQGVSYEPWHWRFVGDRHSLETFYKVRN